MRRREEPISWGVRPISMGLYGDGLGLVGSCCLRQSQAHQAAAAIAVPFSLLLTRSSHLLNTPAIFAHFCADFLLLLWLQDTEHESSAVGDELLSLGGESLLSLLQVRQRLLLSGSANDERE